MCIKTAILSCRVAKTKLLCYPLKVLSNCCMKIALGEFSAWHFCKDIRKNSSKAEAIITGNRWLPVTTGQSIKKNGCRMLS